MLSRAELSESTLGYGIRTHHFMRKASPMLRSSTYAYCSWRLLSQRPELSVRATTFRKRLPADQSHLQTLGPTGVLGIILILLGMLVWGYHQEVWSVAGGQAKSATSEAVREPNGAPVLITPRDGQNSQNLVSLSWL